MMWEVAANAWRGSEPPGPVWHWLTGIVEQEPNALGIAQLSLARQKGLPEIATDRPVEQTLSLITLGEPTPAMKSVIDAARTAAEAAM